MRRAITSTASPFAPVPLRGAAQIDVAEAELAHLRVGGAEGACARFIFWNRSSGIGCAGFLVAREQVERLALPAPVLHDLRGQLDEIPGHAGAGQAAHFHAAQQVVQQVAEFVEDGLHFAMRQQRGLAADGRRQVAADQAQVRLASGRIAGDQRVHPGAAALVFARKPVGVEASRESSADRRSWIS